MRVLVCGGRDFGAIPRWARFGSFQYIDASRRAEQERELLDAMLARYHAEHGIALLIHGDAKGADREADRWAKRAGVQVRPFRADWSDLSHPDAQVRSVGGRKYDAKAGPRRNALMLAEGKPDVVIAFEGGDGTADMVRQAEAAGVPVLSIAASALSSSSVGGN